MTQTIVSWWESWTSSKETIERRRSGPVVRVQGQFVTVKGQFGKEQTFLKADLQVERGSL